MSQNILWSSEKWAPHCLHLYISVCHDVSVRLFPHTSKKVSDNLISPMIWIGHWWKLLWKKKHKGSFPLADSDTSYTWPLTVRARREMTPGERANGKDSHALTLCPPHFLDVFKAEQTVRNHLNNFSNSWWGGECSRGIEEKRESMR